MVRNDTWKLERGTLLPDRNNVILARRKKSSVRGEIEIYCVNYKSHPQSEQLVQRPIVYK